MTRKAPMRRRRQKRRRSAIKTNIEVAGILHDPDASARMAGVIVDGLKGVSERHGITFRHTMRHVHIYETFSGASKLAETNDMGPLGRLLRYLSRNGWLSPSPEVREALEARSNLNRNKQIEATAVDEPAERSVRDIVKGCEAWLDRQIRPLIDHRDVPVEWPRVWRKGLPIRGE